MKKLFSLTTLAAGILLFASCSEISEDERFTYVKPAQVNRAVLIEDFTGQRCVNCPNATDEIDALQEQYGDSAVIAVAIHGGSFGFSGTNKLVGLANDLTKGYCTYWNVDAYGQPIGAINRGGLVKYDTWASAVRTALQQTAPLNLSLYCNYNEVDNTVDITTTAYGTNGTITGKLQLWVVEDSIVALQLLPDGSADYNYVHNHVLRATINGEWGEAITVTEGHTVTARHELKLESSWVPKNLHIIAFVYDDNGVQQVTKSRIRSKFIEWCGTPTH